LKDERVKYNNTTYWTEIHKKYEGKLRAVGHPRLSEHLNQLKYESETRTFLPCLQEIGLKFKGVGGEALSLLDVGAGTGYWSGVAHSVFVELGFYVNVTALDISEDTLEVIRKRSPHVRTICVDLKTINPDRFVHAFDVVLSCYCLHHLVNLDDFLNALRFASRSVKIGGFLMIMDPILTMPFSRFDVIHFSSYNGNGIPRHLYLLEDILGKEVFRREAVRSAVSFLLNGNIQGYGPISYHLADMLWRGLGILDKANFSVPLLSRVLLHLDKTLKRWGLAFSSSVCVYRKSAP
jgi:SAM-dependent methyltransferase